MARKKTPARRGAISKADARKRNDRNTALAASHIRSSAQPSRYAAVAPTHVFTAPDSGVRGEVIRILPPPPVLPPPGGERPTHMHVFFFPGNPGVIEAYRRWLVETHERLPMDVRSETTLHGIGLPGFDVRALNGDSFFPISAMEQYFRAYARSAQVSPPLDESRVVFIGHSFGSFLALRVLEADLSLAARAHIVMLMPVLLKMAECRPFPVRLLTDGPYARTLLLPLVGAALRAAPKRLIHACVDAFGVSEQCAKAAVSRVFDGHRSVVQANALKLAQQEMEEILHPCHLASTSVVGANRAYLFWTDGDTWCTAATVAAIKEAFGDLTVEHSTGEGHVAHAFSTESRQLEHVARSVASWLTGIGRDS